MERPYFSSLLIKRGFRLNLIRALVPAPFSNPAVHQRWHLRPEGRADIQIFIFYQDFKIFSRFGLLSANFRLSVFTGSTVLFQSIRTGL